MEILGQSATSSFATVLLVKALHTRRSQLGGENQNGRKTPQTPLSA